MKKKILSSIAVILMVLFILSPIQITATSSDEEEYILGSDFTSVQFSPKFGETQILLKRGFDFINTGSSSVNWELALTGVTLSDRVYNDTSAEELLKDLGYDKTITTAPLGSDSNSTFHPVSSMGYKRISDVSGNEKNVFAVVVRGTSNLSADWITDLYDGAYSMFDTSRGNVAGDLKKFIQEATGKSIDSLKSEDNYFFISGHSLGGAVANALSVDETVTSLCNGNKEHIYTYTFESPHTCVNLWWMDVEGMSNAYNIKDVDDAVTNVAPYIGATTYGKDMIFSVNDLDNSIFVKVFPNANGISVTNAPHPQNYGDVFGHHDLGLCLVYIMQHGIADGWWDHVHKIDDYISMWTKDEVMVKIDNTSWSDLYRDFILNQQYLTQQTGLSIHGKKDDYDVELEEYSNYEIVYFMLYDFDQNGISELIAYSGYSAFSTPYMYVYTVKDNQMVYMDRLGLGELCYYPSSNYNGVFYSGGKQGGYYTNYTYYEDDHFITKNVSSDVVIDYQDWDKGFNTTILDEELYNAYLECTEPGSSTPAAFNRKGLYTIPHYNFSEISSMGWDEFLAKY